MRTITDSELYSDLAVLSTAVGQHEKRLAELATVIAAAKAESVRVQTELLVLQSTARSVLLAKLAGGAGYGHGQVTYRRT